MASQALPDILNSTFICLKDSDPKIRLAASETLYNCINTLREITLSALNEIFKAIITIISDVDDEVRKGAQSIDRIMKEVVTEACSNFQISEFVEIFCEKMQAINPQIREMMLSWIYALDSIPDTNLIKYLPNFLEELYNILADSNKDIRVAADRCLTQFLKQILLEDLKEDTEWLGKIIMITLKILRKNIYNFSKITALIWIYEFSKLAIEGDYHFQVAILDNLSKILEELLRFVSHSEEELQMVSNKINNILLNLVQKSDVIDSIRIKDLVPALQTLIHSGNV